MTGMEKMWASFIAIGLMFVAAGLITFARTKTRGIIRVVLSVIAFILFIPIIMYMIMSLM
jgi:LPXTG-motif cell wall-anchored protein